LQAWRPVMTVSWATPRCTRTYVQVLRASEEVITASASRGVKPRTSASPRKAPVGHSGTSRLLMATSLLLPSDVHALVGSASNCTVAVMAVSGGERGRGAVTGQHLVKVGDRSVGLAHVPVCQHGCVGPRARAQRGQLMRGSRRMRRGHSDESVSCRDASASQKRLTIVSSTFRTCCRVPACAYLWRVCFPLRLWAARRRW
jgi:hypothetical protein